MNRCEAWDRLNRRKERWESGYRNVSTFYWYEVADHTGDEDPPDFDDLEYAMKQDIDKAYDRYKRDWCENEERICNPMSYYGVSR